MSDNLRNRLLDLQHRVLGDITALEPLEMAVTAALRCVMSDAVYAGVDATQLISDAVVDVHDTAVLPQVRPLIAAGTVLGPMHMQALLDAGIRTVRVIPQPRVVVVSVDEGPGAARIAALAAAVELTDAVSLPVVADSGAQLEDLLDDQLVRADVLVVCGGWTDGAPHEVLVAAQTLGEVDVEYTGITSLPVVGRGRIGVDEVPVVLLPSDPASQLIGFHLLLWPLINQLQGRVSQQPLMTQVVADDAVESYGLEPAQVHASFASSRALADGRRAVRCLQVRTPYALADVDMLVVMPVGMRVEAGSDVAAIALTQPGW